MLLGHFINLSATEEVIDLINKQFWHDAAYFN